MHTHAANIALNTAAAQAQLALAANNNRSNNNAPNPGWAGA